MIVKHKGTVRLETDRLILRRFKIDDAKIAFNNWTGNNRVTEFLRWHTHRDVFETESVFLEWIKAYNKADFYQWAIVLKENRENIGTISVVEIKENISCLHIGYCIGYNYWSKGYTSEAFKCIIEFLFNEVEANRIESQHDPNNIASGKVMKRCGLKYEGTLRKADISNQGIVDACIYSILRGEFKYL